MPEICSLIPDETVGFSLFVFALITIHPAFVPFRAEELCEISFSKYGRSCALENCMEGRSMHCTKNTEEGKTTRNMEKLT